MKIGLSTSVIQRGQTGVSRYVCSLLRAMLEQAGAHQLVLFVLEDDLPLFDFARGGVTFISVPEQYRSPARNIFWHQVLLPKLVRRYELDVLHVPSYRRMLWPRPCALVATIHDLAPFHVKNKYDWKRMVYGRYVARLLARRQHEIIAISQSTARDLAAFFRLPLAGINVVYNGLDHERFTPGGIPEAKAVLAAKYHLQHPYFLSVARLEHPGKNHMRLLQAFEKFKLGTHAPLQLVLAGKDWHGAEVIHAAIAQSPVAQDVRCLGFVDDADLLHLYRAAEALVCPSLFEGFGLPLVEAMACGCPVLCSTAGSLAEVVEKSALTVNAEDVAALQDGLTRLAADSKLRLQLRESGLLRAQAFDWRKTARATLEVYARARHQ